MGKKLSRNTNIAIALISFGGNLAWAVENQYYNVFLYNNIIGDTFVVSLMVAITAIVSTGTTIIMGALSDIRGKRKPFILYSFIFWAVTTALFPFAAFLKPLMLAIAMAILIDCIMSFFGATIYDACYQAHIADVTDESNRGQAMGINEMMMLLATLIVYAGAGPIIAAVGDYYFYIIIGGSTGIIGLIGTYFMKDSEDLEPQDVKLWTHIRSTFNFKTLKEHKDIVLLLTSIAIWAIGFNMYFSYIVIYLEHSLQLTLLTASLVMFVALFTSALLGIPIGKAVDKFGRKRVGIICLIGISIGLVLFGLSTELWTVILTGLMWVIFMTGWRITNGTWIKDLFPRDQQAQFNGFFLVANVLIGMVIGSPIGGWLGRYYGEVKSVTETIKVWQNGGFVEETITKIIIIPSNIIYFVGAAVVIFAIIPILFIKSKEKPEISDDFQE